MVRRLFRLASALSVVAFAAACAQNPETPMSPSAAESGGAANADGSTLKVGAPALAAPADGSQLTTRKPQLGFANATGRFASATLAYNIQLFDGGGALAGEVTIPQGAGTTTYDIPSDLAYGAEFRWRARATLDGQVGPWSALWSFKTPAAPASGGIDTGEVGPARSISPSQALGIIVNIHDTLRIDLGSRSTPDFRRAFWAAAVAAIHYGHPRFNPQGPDPQYCIKDGGGGRPQTDDALVICSTREFWDCIGGAGANGYSFRLVQDPFPYLDRAQNVYPPPASALSFLNR